MHIIFYASYCKPQIQYTYFTPSILGHIFTLRFVYD
ncbi:hypothetical protein E2C01_051897 [Portunus trituberculatus]|uniref:Uncharacterized protein n=1 Tax=Portunus trituberculatus TaxID=210409 RepID=A0A5B7GKX3_PORTR|nr:hypothetical protein [Portunus trituberculatus]